MKPYMLGRITFFVWHEPGTPPYAWSACAVIDSSDEELRDLPLRNKHWLDNQFRVEARSPDDPGPIVLNGEGEEDLTARIEEFRLTAGIDSETSDLDTVIRDHRTNEQRKAAFEHSAWHLDNSVTRPLNHLTPSVN